jgi:hypothetical protein
MWLLLHAVCLLEGSTLAAVPLGAQLLQKKGLTFGLNRAGTRMP